MTRKFGFEELKERGTELLQKALEELDPAEKVRLLQRAAAVFGEAGLFGDADTCWLLVEMTREGAL